MSEHQILLPSAARTAAVSKAARKPEWARGAHVVINVTADPASASITPHIEGYDPASGTYHTVLTGAAIAATGKTVLKVGPGLTAAANVVANDVLPTMWRFRMAVADADSITYSVGVVYG